MKIRFQADADLRVPIINGLRRREPSIDFATAHAAGLVGLDDHTVLALAAESNRVLVSHDVSTMPEAILRLHQGTAQSRGDPHLSGPVVSRSNRRIIASVVKH